MGALLLWCAAICVLAAGVLALFALTDYGQSDQGENADELERESGD